MNRDPAAASRKKRALRSIGMWAVIGALSATALAMAAFAMVGPPSGWGTNVEDAEPSFSAEPSPAARDSLEAMAADTAPTHMYGALLARYDVPGRPRDFDEHAESGEAVLLTSDETWTKDQRLDWRRDRNARWSEVNIPDGFIISNPRLIGRDGQPTLLIERWHPWWPYTKSYVRFARSLTNPELRPEYGIYQLDIERGIAQFLFPGDRLVLSPDRSVAAYVSSERFGLTGGGFHTIYVWDLETDQRRPVMSLWELDPGSGISFNYAWTRDSRALLIAGSTSGVGRSGAPPRGPIRALFTREPRSLYLLK